MPDTSPAPGHAFIGTCGWNYAVWRNTFYGDCPARRWLSFCAERFSAIEVDATFYRLQRRETFERWRDATPPQFRFALKANRYLTHYRRLDDPLPSIRLERDRAAGLGRKLAAVLWQLPRNLHRDADRLARFARALRSWRTVRHVVEFRHESWFDERTARCLREHAIAVCQSDAADWPCWSEVTTDLVYVRLHGHAVTYASGYSDAQLRRWAARIGGWLSTGRDVHVYFDNDALGRAPVDAKRLIERLNRRRPPVSPP